MFNKSILNIKASTMTRLVDTQVQMLDSALGFNKALRDSSHPAHDYLATALSTYRHWYVMIYRGRKIYAPSKVCGYKTQHLNEYAKNHGGGFTGTETEARLKKWTIPVIDPDEISTLELGLSEMLAPFDKNPSALTRFHILKVELASGSQEDPKQAIDKERLMMNMMYACYMALSNYSKSDFKRLIRS